MAANAKKPQFNNSNRWNTRQLVTMALMCAIASLFSFVQIPLIPGVSFLTYDPSLSCPLWSAGSPSGLEQASPWDLLQLSSMDLSWENGSVRS